jgi:hypothetical protein
MSCAESAGVIDAATVDAVDSPLLWKSSKRDAVTVV